MIWVVMPAMLTAVECECPGAPQVAYMDLARVRLQADCGLADVGPAACLAGRLTLLPGMCGTPAQARSGPSSSPWSGCTTEHPCMLSLRDADMHAACKRMLCKPESRLPYLLAPYTT